MATRSVLAAIFDCIRFNNPAQTKRDLNSKNVLMLCRRALPPRPSLLVSEIGDIKGLKNAWRALKDELDALEAAAPECEPCFTDVMLIVHGLLDSCKVLRKTTRCIKARCLMLFYLQTVVTTSFTRGSVMLLADCASCASHS